MSCLNWLKNGGLRMSVVETQVGQEYEQNGY